MNRIDYLMLSYARRPMKRGFLILLVASIAVSCFGQTRRTSLRAKVDSILSAKYNKVNYDTNYIGRPEGKLTLKLRTNISGSDYNVHRRISGAEGSSKLKTARMATLSIGASYKGISAGLSLNPASLSGRNKDYELNINAYGNRYGIDVIYQSSRTLSGPVTFNGKEVQLERGMADMQILIIDAYYAFNGRRFSYPAAFTQSFVQKRSAGSWLVGLTYLGGRIKTTDEKPSEASDLRIYTGHFAIGGGYGYNFVIGRHLLLHLSALPTLVIANRNNIEENGVRQDMDTKFPDFILTERLSVVYHFNKKYFAGATFVMSNTFLDDHRIDINYRKWRLRAFLGIRI